MLSDQRLSVTFGAFSCDVVGYDDPFAILTRVVELFGEIAKSNPAFGAGEVPMSDMERARLAAGLAAQASRIDELADKTAPNGMRYVVSNAEAVSPEIPDTIGDGAAADDEVVIAALADEAAYVSDLELRDTLEAVGSAEPAPEEEIVALDIAPAAPVAAPVIAEEMPTSEAPLELTEPIETPVLVEAPAGADEPVIAETVLANEMAETPIQLVESALNETDQEATGEEAIEAAEPAVESDAASIATSTAAAIASLVEVKAGDAPVRQPLRLNMSSLGVEPEKNTAPADKPEVVKAEVEPEKPQRRVTITSLPLRPERPKQVDQPETYTKHSLTPVQKVAPVVTFSANIGDSAEDTPKPSRAERIRAKMEQRDSEDDGENFLFADVEEALRGDTPADLNADEDAEAKRAQNISPLVFNDPSPEATAPLDEPAKKTRRSIANLLGFGKSAATTSKPALEMLEPKVKTSERAENNYDGDTDGFVRLRESVAAAMPTADEPTVIYPAVKSPPESISEAIDYDDETSPTAFARRVGANSLQDLLEASAVYMDVVEGKSRFSRRDVMQALNQIGADNDYTQEARLKSFRKLLTTGSLVRVDDGLFTVSQATRFGYETRMQA